MSRSVATQTGIAREKATLLSLEEQETVIRYDATDALCVIDTHDNTLLSKLRKFRPAVLIEAGRHPATLRGTWWARFEVPKEHLGALFGRKGFARGMARAAVPLLLRKIAHGSAITQSEITDVA
jgi:hypothetical protein